MVLEYYVNFNSNSEMTGITYFNALNGKLRLFNCIGCYYVVKVCVVKNVK